MPNAQCPIHNNFLIMNHDDFIVPINSKISLKKDYDTAFTAGYKEKGDAQIKLQKDIERLAKYQDILYAQNQNGPVWKSCTKT